jgi:hypothetical protein
MVGRREGRQVRGATRTVPGDHRRVHPQQRRADRQQYGHQAQ